MKLCSCFGALLCGGVAILSLNVGAQEDWAKLPAASATNAPPAKPARVVQVAQPPVAQPIPAGQPVQAVPMAQPQTAQIPQPVQAAPVTQPVQIAQPAQPVRIVQPPQVPDVAQPGLAAPVAQTAATAQPVQVAQPVQPTQFAQPVQTVQSVQPVPAAQPIQTIPTAQPVQAVQATQPIQYAQPVATTVEPTAVPQTVQATQPVQAVQAVQPVQAAQPVQVTAPVQAIPAAQPAQPIQTVQAVQPTAAVQQVQASQAAVPVQPTPAPQAAQTVQASQPVQPTPVAAPVQSTPTPQPVQATPAAQPVRSVQSVQPVLPVDAAPASTQTIAQSTPAVQAAQSSHRTRASQVEEPLSGAPPAELDVPVQAVQSTQAVPSVMSAPTTQAGQPVPTQANAQTAVTTQPAVAPQPAQAAATNTIPDAATLAAQLYQTNQFTQPALGAPQNSTSLPVVLAGQLTLDPADIIIYNAKVLTLDTNFTIAQSIAIRSNIVLGVGKNKDMAVYQGPLTRSIDARGRVVMPGLYDGFVQSYGAAVSELNGAMPVLDSIAAAQEYIRRQSTNRPPGSWIVLHDLFPTRLKEGRLPTKGELDAASTNNPVVWHLGSLAIVNSKALEASHIVKESVDPKGGLIVRDHKFKPNGVLRNTAIAMLRMPPQPPAPNTRQRREALKALYALYNQHGITSIAEQNATTNAIDVFRDLAASNELTVRINVSRTIDPGTNDLDGAITMLESMTNAPTGKNAYGPTGAGDDWVRIGALNFYLDGDVTLANAFLRTPYGIGATYDIAEPAYRSVLKPEPHVMSDLCWEATTRGWQLSAYCSGDAALDFALNCYERIAFQTNIQDRRFAITHNDFQASQAWPRCTNLNVVANLQPTCLNLDGASLAKTLGEQRLTWFMPIKSWTDRGLVVGAGSDHRAGTNSFDSISPWNPWLGIWITVTRETESGTVLNPEERLSREQAIRLYTSNNAWNHFEDRKKGSLELGKYADLIMLDTDVLECPVDDIRATGVLLTMVNGRVVWESRNNWAISTVSAYRPPEPQ